MFKILFSASEIVLVVVLVVALITSVSNGRITVIKLSVILKALLPYISVILLIPKPECFVRSNKRFAVLANMINIGELYRRIEKSHAQGV